MSMWKKIRLLSEITLEEMGKRVNRSKQMLSQCENGKAPMPIELQIEYLKLRNSKEDRIIIKYLEGLMKNGK